MCQCGSINCKKKIPLWWEMLIAEEAVHVAEHGYMRALCIQFFCESKIVLNVRSMAFF